MMEKTILITGGAGFIGSNLTEYFLAKGYKVVVLDNFATGHRHNLAAVAAHPQFKLIEGDIRNINDCVVAVEGVDYVLHQAALGSVPRSIGDPVTTNDVNVSGFLNMLVAARDAKVKRFVYAASSSTYGDSQGLPKVEGVIGKPLSPYAITKYVNELYAEIFGKAYGLETIGLRYFNVFGPKQDPHGAYAAVIPLFFKAALDGNAPVINGDGNNSRDFTYVDNAVEANLLALFTTNNNAVNQVYNVACGERTTLNELWSAINQITGVGLEAIHGPGRDGDIAHSLADISKAKTLLGYTASIKIADGLERAFNWYKNQNKI